MTRVPGASSAAAAPPVRAEPATVASSVGVPELEEAASVAGSPLATVLRRIIVPLATPALLAGWLFIFLIAARDLSLAVILASPSVQPVSAAMFDLWANGQGTELAAFGLVWTAIMTVIAAAFYLVGRRTIMSAVKA